MKPIMGMEELCIREKECNGPFYYRNKAQFPVGLNKEGRIVSGFYAGRTHSIIEVDSCILGAMIEADAEESSQNKLEISNGESVSEMVDVNKAVMDIVKVR